MTDFYATKHAMTAANMLIRNATAYGMVLADDRGKPVWISRGELAWIRWRRI